MYISVNENSKYLLEKNNLSLLLQSYRTRFQFECYL